MAALDESMYDPADRFRGLDIDRDRQSKSHNRI